MFAATVDVVMLGSSIVSSSCSVAAPLRINNRGRALAIAMPIAMTLTVFSDRKLLACTVALATVGLSASLLMRSSSFDLHRALGGGLMSIFVFAHVGLMHVSEGAGAPNLGGGHVPVPHGSGTHLVAALTVPFAAAFALWTAREVVNLHRRSITLFVAVEFISMAISVTSMAVGVVLAVHSMHT